MATDLYNEVLWNDGEDITFGDLNDDQRFLAAKLFDQVLGKLIASPTAADPEFISELGANPSTAWCYALSVGGGNPRQGSSNNKVKIGAGTLLQKIGNSDGSNATLLAVTLDGTDEVTIANGDATNPRVDMIQIALSYVDADSQIRDFKDAVTGANSTGGTFKKHKVQYTISVKQGTPNATPVYPTPDAGNVPIACVVVGATYSGAAALKYIDTAGAVAVLHDLRMPIRTTPYRVSEPRLNPSITNRTLGTFNSGEGFGSSQIVDHQRFSNRWWFNDTSASPVYWPLDFLEPGDVITGWAIDLEKLTNGTGTVTADIVYQDTSGEHSAGFSASDSHNATGFAFPFLAGGSVAVVTGRSYYLKFTPAGMATPAGDKIYDVHVSYKRLGAIQTTSNGGLIAVCPRPAGRLIAVSAMTANGSHTATTSKLVARQPTGTDLGVADVSAMAETGSTPTRHQYKMGDIESHAMFAAGPTVTGNGTHNPPIWGNGKRCYEEEMSINSSSDGTPYQLALFMTYATGSLPDLYETTFYMAEGL